MATAPASTQDLPPPGLAPSSLLDLAPRIFRTPALRNQAVGLLACLGLLAATFWPTLKEFVRVWSTDDNYSHGFLVPLISLYFANEASKRGPVPVRSGVVLGVILLLAAILGRMATVLVPIGIVDDGSFLLGLAGIVSLLAGSGALRRYWFALAFLIFMVPLPVAMYSMIASPLQLFVSQIASALLNALGIPVLREGTIMTLPGDVRMFVAEACSGTRQLTGFLALTTAVAYMSARPAWYRVVVIASAIPVALLANLTRVTLTGVIMSVDPRYALGTFHTVEGLLMMVLGLSLLGAECWVLNRLAEAGGGRSPAMALPKLQAEGLR